MGKLRITYKKSAIGYSYDQKETIRSLGLHKLNSTVIQDDSPSIRGMVFKVRHLVSVEELGDVEVAPRVRLAAPRQAAAQVGGDELEIVEGIGPKIAGVLRRAGITTFAQLAEQTPEQIGELLRAARIRLAFTESWPAQARLAAEGRWDELKALQAELTAGRAEGGTK